MADINVVAENLTELLTNTVNMTDIFYDMFINPQPMDITLYQYNSNNELVPVVVPNRAKDRKIALTGTVAPEVSTDPLVQNASIGVCYVNVLNNDVYFRIRESGNNKWIKVVTEADLLDAINSLEVVLSETYVPLTRKVNGKPLSSDISLTYSDVDALSGSSIYGSSLTFINSTLSLLGQNGSNLSSVDLSSTQGANVSLSNLSSAGEDKLEAIKGYETGTGALSDNTLYTFIKGLYDNSSISGTDIYDFGSTVSVPYKLGKTGCKIVLSTYETAVASVYSNLGYALYYVIDTTNETVTIPRGDIFGFITTATNPATTITYW